MIYFLQNTYTKHIKIGSSNDVLSRLYDTQSANSYPIILLGIMPGNLLIERQVQAKFVKYKIRGEWFEPDETIMEYINKNCNFVDDRDESGKVIDFNDYIKNLKDKLSINEVKR
jgi:hypothetical protein